MYKVLFDYQMNVLPWTSKHDTLWKTKMNIQKEEFPAILAL